MADEIHLIINKRSRRARAEFKTIQATLRRQNFHIDKVHDLAGGETAKVCKQIIRSKPKLVIIGGGDGTISHVLHYFVKSGIEIGVIPLGTTNNFSRSLNIPHDIEGAVAVIKEAGARPVDMGTVNGRYFANVVGVGISTVIASTIDDKAKKRWGRFAYAIKGVQQLFTHRAFTVTLSDKDDELSYSVETHQLIIANGKFHAGKKIAQDAAIDNRELVVFALGGRGWISFGWHMLDFYLGRRKKIVHGTYVIGRTIKIETDRPQAIEIDGEPGATTPLTMAVEHEAVLIRHYA